MSPLVIHVLLFLVGSLAIVGLGSCYADAEDGPALRNFPRRFGFFVGGCTVLALIMLLVEQVFASVR